jgi:small subunit ribosomal protein S6
VNEYEIMILLDPELAEERGNEIVQRIRDSVEGSQGTWDGHEPWGRRRLAFEIDKKGEAVYHLVLFTTTPETLAEITRVLKITDGVMRHGAFRRVKGGHLKAPSQIPVPPPSAADEAHARAAAAPAAAPAPKPAAEPETEPEADLEPVPAAVTAADDTSAAADDTAEAAE